MITCIFNFIYKSQIILNKIEVIIRYTDNDKYTRIPVNKKIRMFPLQSFPSQSPLLCKVTTRDEKFATIALNEANKSTVKYHQHGCVAVVGGRIVERGYNSYRSRSNDGFLEGTCSCHAEVDVMRKLEKRLNKSSNNYSTMNKGNKSKNNKSKNNKSKNSKNWQVSGRDVTQCFLRAREPIRCKKRQAWGEV